MAPVVRGKEIAEVYDVITASAFDPVVLGPTVDFLAALVGTGKALEFAIGTGRVFALEPNHVGIDTFDDLLGQVSWSHHWIEVSGQWLRQSAPYRYVWPTELDLMARIAGLRLRERWADWDRTFQLKQQISSCGL
jgi:hypothetical protein